MVYLLKFLKASSTQSETSAAGSVRVEYRLACSGEFYNCRVETFEWRKSDITRVLLRTPLELFVASHPFNSYPQELCVRLNLSVVTEQEGRATRTILPDEDIVEDLCSLITILSRRLVSPVCKTREICSGPYPALGSFGSDYPTPILPRERIAAWSQRPITVLTSMKGQEIIFNNPPPVGVDPNALSSFLLKLPGLPNAVNIVYAARLYRTAFELIESRPDIAYLLLISTVECFADLAFIDYDPEQSEKLETPEARAVQKRARDFGLDDDKARQLGLEACKGNRWLSKKFKRFLTEFSSPEELAERDRLFALPEYLCPPLEEFSKIFGRIYSARSVNLHQAVPFPESVGIGTSTTVSWRQLPLSWPFDQPDIPPVTWFERAVSQAVHRFLSEKGGVATKPFLS